MQQWFQAVYAQGLDTPIERSVHLVLRLAAGDADALSGRYLSVEDDLNALVKQVAAEPPADQRIDTDLLSTMYFWSASRVADPSS